ncbi:MAG: Hpt domain-containing protein [Gammaproteobacteria bacterium]|nr:Hpt domain-containing protein [Gammaproteobacteria bacterium]NVK89055.1 Hpt domain-containing protein [Gammaproteobacteria bacterium]
MKETVEQLKELLGADFSELVSAFENDNRMHIDKIKLALANGDAATVASEAHSIKGASSNLGAVELAEKCQLLETAGKNNDLPSDDSLVTEIEALFNQAVAILHQA